MRNNMHKILEQKNKSKNFSESEMENNSTNFCATYDEIQNSTTTTSNYSLENVTGGNGFNRRFTAAILALLPVLPNVRAAGGKDKSQKRNNPTLHITSAGLPDLWTDSMANERLAAIIENVKNNRSDDVNSAYGRKSRTPLMYAASTSNVDIVGKLLSRGAKIDAQDADGWTPLMFAIARSNPIEKMEIIEKLLGLGADINLHNNQGKTAMDLAFEERNEQIVSCILRNYAASKGLDITNGDLLLSAIQEKNYSIAKALLNKNPHMDITAKNEHGQTALMLAVEDGQTEIIRELLNKDAAIINETNEDGFTALMLATLKGDGSTVSLLLQSPTINLTIKDKSGRTALEIAMQEENADIVKKLLTKKPSQANELGRDGITPLMVAIQKGYTNAASVLIESPNVDINMPDKFGKTPLMLAVQWGKSDIVEKLLKKRPDININAVDKAGWSALMFAASYGNTKILEDLIEHGAKVDIKDKNECTPLMIATWSKRDDLIEKLLAHEAVAGSEQSETLSDSYKGALTFALAKKQFDHANQILARGLVSKIDKPLYAIVKNTFVNALINDDFERADEILGNISNLNIELNEAIGGTDEYRDKTILMLAISKNEEIANKLLDRAENWSESIDAQDECGQTALMLAIEEGHFNIVKRLLDAGANFNLTDNAGKTALANIAQKGAENPKSHQQCSKIISHILKGDKYFVPASIKENVDISEFLIFVAETWGKDAVIHLLNAKDDKKLIEDYYTCALIFALKNGHFQELNGMLQNDDVNHINPYIMIDNKNILQMAINTNVISGILNKIENASLNADDNIMETLEKALSTSRTDIILGILDKIGSSGKHDPKYQDPINNAFVDAAYHGRSDIVQKMMEKKDIIDLNPGAQIPHYSNKTALIFAAQRGHSKVASVLLEQGDPDSININAMDNRSNRTALDWAIYFNHPEIAKQIREKSIEWGLDPNICASFDDAWKKFDCKTMLTLIDICSNQHIKPGISNETFSNILLYAVDNGQEALAVKIIENAEQLGITLQSNLLARVLKTAYNNYNCQIIIAIVGNAGKLGYGVEDSKKMVNRCLNAAKDNQDIQLTLKLIEYASNLGIDVQVPYKIISQSLFSAIQKGDRESALAILPHAQKLGLIPTITDADYQCLIHAIDCRHTPVAISVFATATQQFNDHAKSDPTQDLKKYIADGNELMALATLKGNLTHPKMNINAVCESQDFLYRPTIFSLAIRKGMKQLTLEIINNAKTLGLNINAKNNFGHTALSTALQSGETDIAKEIIKNADHLQLNINQADNQGTTPLLLAMLHGNSQIALYILENAQKLHLNCVETDPASVEKRQAYIEKVRAQSDHLQVAEIIENIDNLGINISKLLPKPNSLLTYIRKMPWEISCALIKNAKKFGIDINAPLEGYKKSQTILSNSISLFNKNVVSQLIASATEIGLNINQQNSDGNNALLVAIECNQDDIASLILENAERLGLDIEAKNKKGLNALGLAKLKGKELLVKAILKKSAPIPTLSEEKIEGARPTATAPMGVAKTSAQQQFNDQATQHLIQAIDENNELLALIILKNNKVNINAVDTNGRNILSFAIYRDMNSLVSEIIDNAETLGLNINAKNNFGHTALSTALFHKKSQSITRIIHNADHLQLNINQADDYGTTPLLLAILKGQINVALYILDHAQELHLDCVETDPISRAKRKAYIEKVRAQNDRSQGVAIIDHLDDELGVNIKQMIEKPDSILVYNSSSDKDVMYALIKKFGIDVNKELGNKRRTALLDALRRRNDGFSLQIISCAEELGLDINKRDEDGNNALLLAIKTDKSGIALEILKKAKILGLDINAKNNVGEDALTLARSKGNDQLEKAIRELAQTTPTREEKIESPKPVAEIEDAKPTATAPVAEPKAPAPKQFDDHLDTDATQKLIEVITFGNQLHALSIFRNYKIDINALNKDGMDILTFAICQRMETLATEIIKNRAAPELDINKKDKNGNNALLLAIEYGEDNVALSILENAQRLGLDINAKNNQNITALSLAKKKRKESLAWKIAEELARTIPPSEEKTENAGPTATVPVGVAKTSAQQQFNDRATQQLIQAIENRNEGLAISILENNKVNINAVDTSGRRILSSAIYKNMNQLATKIIGSANVLSLDINKRDFDGNDALISAIKCENYNIAFQILNNAVNLGLDVYAENLAHESASNLALNTSNTRLSIKLALAEIKLYLHLRELETVTPVITHPLEEDHKKDTNPNDHSKASETVTPVITHPLEEDHKKDTNPNDHSKASETVAPVITHPLEEDCTEDLMKVIRARDEMRALDILKNKKVNINAQNKRGIRILSLAMHNNLSALAQEIMKREDLDINAGDSSGHTPLLSAIFHQNSGIAKEIIKNAKRLHLDINQEDNYGTPPLLLAILKGQSVALDILENAEKLGLNCVKMDPTSVAKRQACIQSLKKQFANNPGAAIIDHIDELGIDVKKLFKNPDTHALMCFRYSSGKVPLALVTNAKKIGININQNFDGTTILLDSIKRDARSTVFAIIDCSKELELEINQKDDDGNNALLSAIKLKRYEIAFKILENAKKLGLDINAKNNEGITALDMAEGTGNEQLKSKILELCDPI